MARACFGIHLRISGDRACQWGHQMGLGARGPDAAFAARVSPPGPPSRPFGPTCASCQGLPGTWKRTAPSLPALALSRHLADISGGQGMRQARPSRKSPLWAAVTQQWPHWSTGDSEHKAEGGISRLGWQASWGFAVASGGRAGDGRKAESQSSEPTPLASPPSLPGGNLQGPGGLGGGRKRP